MSTDSNSTTLEGMLPTCLEDIITINRNKLQFERVMKDSLFHLNKAFPITNLKGVLIDAFLYKRIIPALNSEEVFLVGFSQCDDGHEFALHTSYLKGYDFENNVALTNSGSHYIIKSFIDGEPHYNLLLHICYMAHRDGWGSHFGIAPIFY